MILRIAWLTMIMFTLFGSTGCKPAAEPTPTRSPALVVQLHPQCLVEDVALPATCNEAGALPLCLTEDSGIDSPGPMCFWKDPDTGNLWFSNGVPGRQ